MSQSMKTRAPVTDKDFGPNAKRPFDDGDGDQDVGAAGKKRKKTKEKKEKAVKTTGGAVKTRTHPFIVTILTLLFALLLAAAGLFLLYFDVGGIKAPFVEFFLDTPLAHEIQELIFLDRELAIEEREQTVAFLQDYHEQWQLDLEARERQFAQEIAAFERQQLLAEDDDLLRAEEIAYLEGLLSGRQSLEEAAAPYARMDADEAAALLAAMDRNLALQIFNTLNTARKALILAALSVEDAVRFTEDSVWIGSNPW